MKTFSTYQIISELRINIEYYCGLIGLKDLVKVRNQLLMEMKLNEQYNFLVDLRDAEFDLSSDIVEEFILNVKSNRQLIWKRKTAILTNTPNQAAFSNLYITHLGNLPIFVNEFNTLEGALKWIDLSKRDEQVVELKIELLRRLAI